MTLRHSNDDHYLGPIVSYLLCVYSFHYSLPPGDMELQLQCLVDACKCHCVLHYINYIDNYAIQSEGVLLKCLTECSLAVRITLANSQGTFPNSFSIIIFSPIHLLFHTHGSLHVRVRLRLSEIMRFIYLRIHNGKQSTHHIQSSCGDLNFSRLRVHERLFKMQP